MRPMRDLIIAKLESLIADVEHVFGLMEQCSQEKDPGPLTPSLIDKEMPKEKVAAKNIAEQKKEAPFFYSKSTSLDG